MKTNTIVSSETSSRFIANWEGSVQCFNVRNSIRRDSYIDRKWSL